MIDVVVPCSCPGVPHKEDTVSLVEKLDVRIGSAAMAAMRAAPALVSDMEGGLSGAFIHFGIRAWTFVDDKKEPLPVTFENIDARLTWANGGLEVVEKANELYAGDLFRPLLARMSKDSPTGPTESSIKTDDSSSIPATPSLGSNTGSSDKPSLHAVSGGKRSAEKAS